MELQEIETQQPRTEKSNQEELHEQTADSKRSYQESIAAELKEWATTVDRLKADVQQSGAEVRRTFEKHIERLRDKKQVPLRHEKDNDRGGTGLGVGFCVCGGQG